MSFPGEDPFVGREAWALLVGEKLGFGSAREVWSSRLEPGAVVKLERGGASFQNVLEWTIWEGVRETGFAKWFAPCLHISPCGGILVQRRTQTALKYPQKLPMFLTDWYRGNYGMLDGRFVCHDYGLTTMLEFGLTNRMRKVTWRG